MFKALKKNNFPDGAYIKSATVSIADMGEKTISTTIVLPYKAFTLADDMSIGFDGETYVLPDKMPNGTKNTQSLDGSIDIVFIHKAIRELKRNFFFTYEPIDSGTAVADKYIASVVLNLGKFVNAYARLLEYWYGDNITIDLNPDWAYNEAATAVSISYTKMWELLDELYDLYGVRWTIQAREDNPDKYVIKVGYPSTQVSHILQYGYDGGLLSIQRNRQSEELANMLLGRGGSKNLPYRYFKEADPDNPSFAADPDAIPELANITFTELRGKTFRDYVKGWKAKHYGGEPMAEPTWAYFMGYRDIAFNPPEYVKDDASIAKYGAIWNGLENNEDIYPTIQERTIDGIGRIDECLDVETIYSDDVEEATKEVTTSSDIETMAITLGGVEPGGYVEKTAQGYTFVVPEGKTANLEITDYGTHAWERPGGAGGSGVDHPDEFILSEPPYITVHNMTTGEDVAAVGIPSGTWRYDFTVKGRNTNEAETRYLAFYIKSLKLTTSDAPAEQWGSTFSIWVRNIWNTSKGAQESAEAYANRVWGAILGDRTGGEAAVIFTDGLLSVSDDYEFVIDRIPEYDVRECPNGELSHWKITLRKSDAELDATGLYLPNTKINAAPGNHFAFIGIDMPYLYTLLAEEKLDLYKQAELDNVKDIKPSWQIELVKQRLNELGDGDTEKLIDLIKAGSSIRIADVSFITDAPYNTLYITAVTYTFDENSGFTPSVSITLSDEYKTSVNAIGLIRGDIDAIYQRLGTLSNIEQAIRSVGDKVYLRKDGIKERSLSPTFFLGTIGSDGFTQGQIGGNGWGTYTDANGKWVVETDRLVVRDSFDVNTLVINQIDVRGGTIIESAASITITRVEEMPKAYVCYFDDKLGAIGNLFKVGDVAYSQVFNPDNTDYKMYKRRVTAVSSDSITLSKSVAYTGGSGLPEVGDVVVQYGSYVNINRTFVKVRDVIGGGYERYISGLTSVTASGNEYYFVGRQSGMYNNKPRWFIGSASGEYAEYINGVLTINGHLSVTTKVGDVDLSEYIKAQVGIDGYEYLKDALNDTTSIIGGLMLTSLIALGQTAEDGTRTIYAGISGIYNDSKSIASWWGGEMADAQQATTSTRPAKALVRMDGSGYFAAGNISWNADGSGYVANENIKWDNKGGLTLGSGIKIILGEGETGLATTLSSILEYINGINMLFTPVDADGNEIAFRDYANAAMLKAKIGLYSLGDIAAFGGGSSGGGGSVDPSIIQDIIDRVEANEDDIATLQTDVARVQTLINTASGQIVALDGRLTTVEGDLATLSTDYTTTKQYLLEAQNDIDTLQSQMQAAQSDIQVLQNDTASIRADVDALDNKMLDAVKPRSYINANVLFGVTTPMTLSDVCTKFDGLGYNNPNWISLGTIVTFLTSNGWVEYRFLSDDAESGIGNLDYWELCGNVYADTITDNLQTDVGIYHFYGYVTNLEQAGVVEVGLPYFYRTGGYFVEKATSDATTLTPRKDVYNDTTTGKANTRVLFRNGNNLYRFDGSDWQTLANSGDIDALLEYADNKAAARSYINAHVEFYDVIGPGDSRTTTLADVIAAAEASALADTYKVAGTIFAFNTATGWQLWLYKGTLFSSTANWVLVGQDTSQQEGGYTKSEVNNLLDAKADTTALTDGSVTKVGTSTVGSAYRPMYLSAGTPTAMTGTRGSSSIPVYLSNGTINQCGYNFINYVSLVLRGQVSNTSWGWNYLRTRSSDVAKADVVITHSATGTVKITIPSALSSYISNTSTIVNVHGYGTNGGAAFTHTINSSTSITIYSYNAAGSLADASFWIEIYVINANFPTAS